MRRREGNRTGSVQVCSERISSIEPSPFLAFYNLCSPVGFPSLRKLARLHVMRQKMDTSIYAPVNVADNRVHVSFCTGLSAAEPRAISVCHTQ